MGQSTRGGLTSRLPEARDVRMVLMKSLGGALKESKHFVWLSHEDHMMAHICLALFEALACHCPDAILSNSMKEDQPHKRNHCPDLAWKGQHILTGVKGARAKASSKLMIQK